MMEQLAAELKLPAAAVRRAAALLDAGNTVPFIARYRKEQTQGLDAPSLYRLQERLKELRQLAERREQLLARLDGRGELTPELAAALKEASTLQELADLYRPYRQTRRTRADAAREQGLAPLAASIWALPEPLVTRRLLPLARQALRDEETTAAGAEEALAGAADILAENLAHHAPTRQALREAARQHAELLSQQRDQGDPQGLFRPYHDFRQPVRRLASHQVLALNRGEAQEALKVSIQLPQGRLVSRLLAAAQQQRQRPQGEPPGAWLREVVQDAYQRLIAPALERSLRTELTEQAQSGALDLFADNLRQLLMQPPLKGRVVMGVDPAYRTGVKLAVVDATGALLSTAVIYPTPPRSELEAALDRLKQLVNAHDVTRFAVGNGTASRETEQVIARLIRELPERDLAYAIVDEAGASVYSASQAAAAEFPGLDVSERSAVSIARRLQDPLAELVKIDPRSLGVGQYQHDLDETRLRERLGQVVEECVNTVGVDINTASEALLQHVAGIGPSTAAAITAFRQEKGAFSSRQRLLDVPGIGPKTFEQAAGFLRVAGGSEPLDNTPVHPESYGVAYRLLSQAGVSKASLHQGGAGLRQRLSSWRQDRDLEAAAASLGTGRPTLTDILEALARPGRDVRDDVPPPLFRTDVLSMEDLEPGMVLEGQVRNIVDFGAFVDIGVKQDGLIHISEMADRYVEHPGREVAIGQRVKVRILSVDPHRGRIGLSLRGV